MVQEKKKPNNEKKKTTTKHINSLTYVSNQKEELIPYLQEKYDWIRLLLLKNLDLCLVTSLTLFATEMK